MKKEKKDSKWPGEVRETGIIDETPVVSTHELLERIAVKLGVSIE